MASSRWADLVLYRRLLRQARPYWPHIAAIVVLELLGSALVLLTPLPLKIAVDSVGCETAPAVLDWLLATPSRTAMLVGAAVLLVTVAVFTQVQSLASTLLRTYVGEKLVLGFRSLLFRHVQRLSLAYHDTRGSAESTYRIQYDAPAIQYIVVDGVIPLLSAVLTFVAMLCIIVRLDWQLALVALLVAPVLTLAARVANTRLRRRSREVKKLEASALSVVHEVLTALRVVKAFGQEEREHERFLNQARAGMRARLRLLLIEGGLGLVVGLTTAIGTAVVLFLGMEHVQAGTLSLGEALLILAYVAQLYAPLKTISKKAADVQASLASAERAFGLLDEAPDVAERPGARALTRAAGAVTFRGVSFAYEQDNAILHDVTFDVAGGTRVGIAGATGAGKSTLVSLLMRLYDPTIGQVLLDGTDVRDYCVADLRNQFAVVLQDSVLFSASIAENVGYARPDASEDEIVAAAKAANAHEFILRLPDGYQTRVGERGLRLSGGERQRIGLARAFLKDAPILILDEPTSAVDVETEAVILQAMERLMRGRTSFLIAHRLNTLARCDVLLWMDNGRLIETTRPMPGSSATSPRRAQVLDPACET